MTLTGIYDHRYNSVLEAVQHISATASRRMAAGGTAAVTLELMQHELHAVIRSALGNIADLDALTGDAPGLDAEVAVMQRESKQEVA